MEQYTGKAVFAGIAVGRIRTYVKAESIVKRTKISDPETEILRYNNAGEAAKEQLQELYRIALDSAGEENASIFEVHQMMLEDEDYRGSVFNIIRTEQVNAEYAVAKTADNYSEMFKAIDNEYMKARAADIKDISDRVINILAGKEAGPVKVCEKVIILADDLSPSETIQLDMSMVLAFVTVHGSLTSHTAILARTMNIPALIGVGIDDLKALDGRSAIVDGFTGTLYVDPDELTVETMQTKLDEEKEKRVLLKQLKGKPTKTLDGRTIHLYANIGSIGDIAIAQDNDAEGIGLFRSEFIYMQAKDYPTEEDQFLIYKQALQLMGSKKLIIRTCDIGADKQVDYFGLEKEDNPALGYRAIRICLDRIDFFKTQLRALYRAAIYGNLSIMYPMIISLDEVKLIKNIVRTVQTELEEEGIPFRKDIEQGIMIETPAAAIISRRLAKEVDFFSIGTNDLTQYTLAIDRQNPKLEAICDTHHEAILFLIKLVIDSAHAEGKWVGICGELASDLELTETFVKMGIDELSVSPGMLLRLRQRIRETEGLQLPVANLK